eukprot:s2739_g6.t2
MRRKGQHWVDGGASFGHSPMVEERRDAALFGVFDGHGGEQVARFTVRRLPQVLATFGGDMEASFSQAYLHLDELLRHASSSSELRDLTLPGNETQDNAENCGTTAVCCLIQGQEMILAHVGDSRAVLCQQGRAVRLTEDHKPELPRESARIEAAGGFVQEGATAMGSGKEYRVNGGLNLSRALGDLRYKSDVKLKPAEHSAAMFRFGAVSALAITAVTADSILDGALAWIKTNGQEANSSLNEHARNTESIGHHSALCCSGQDCLWIALQVWSGLQPRRLGCLCCLGFAGVPGVCGFPAGVELKNSSFVQSAKDQTIKAFQATNHDNLEKFCGQPDCVNGVEDLEKEYGTCYGGTLCASMSENFDYAKCKAAMEDNLPKSFRSQEHSACAKDGDFYCAQQLASLLMQNSTLVSAVPDTKRLPWTVGVDEFVLLASDGVWECMEDQQAVNFVRSRLPPPGSRKGLVPVLQELLDTCCASTPTQRGGLGCDNMTVVIVRFEDLRCLLLSAPQNIEKT